MNQDSSFPPMLPPSTELGALLFAVLPCLQESYRPLASFAYHMTELTKLKTIPAIPPLSGLSGIEALITDKDIMLRSLSFYGKMFRMPLLSTIATLLQGMQFYQTYKDILPGLFSSMGAAGSDPTSSFRNMAGLFSGLGGLSSAGGASPDLFSMLGGLSPDLLSGLISGFSGGSSSHDNSSFVPAPDNPTDTTHDPDNTHPSEACTDTTQPPDTVPVSVASVDSPKSDVFTECSEESPEHLTSETSESIPSGPSPSAPDGITPSEPSDDLFNSLYSFLTPEQQKIYEQLMHTD